LTVAKGDLRVELDKEFLKRIVKFSGEDPPLERRKERLGYLQSAGSKGNEDHSHLFQYTVHEIPHERIAMPCLFMDFRHESTAMRPC
jgi:hypothetical protein